MVGVSSLRSRTGRWSTLFEVRQMDFSTQTGAVTGPVTVARPETDLWPFNFVEIGFSVGHVDSHVDDWKLIFKKTITRFQNWFWNLFILRNMNFLLVIVTNWIIAKLLLPKPCKCRQVTILPWISNSTRYGYGINSLTVNSLLESINLLFLL